MQSVPLSSTRRRRFPLLVIPDHKNIPIQTEEDDPTDPITSDTRSLYCVLLKQPLHFQIQLPSQFQMTQRFCGSSHGWLITSTVDDHDIVHISLFNPFSENPNPNNNNNNNNSIIINLPPITENLEELPYAGDDDDAFRNNLDLYYNHYVAKVVLSCDPASNPDDYAIMAIYGGYCRLAFIRPGTDTTWTYLEKRKPYKDVIYYQEKFYAVDCTGSIHCYEINNNNHNPLIVTMDFPSVKFSLPLWTIKYVVESAEGDLLMVHKTYEREHGKRLCTTGFRVFRLVKEECPGEWTEIKSLGDSVLFLGDNYSACIRASDFPGCSYLKNSIYFTPKNYDAHPVLLCLGYTDMGVFHLEDGSVEPIDYNTHVMSRQTPIWITHCMHEY